MLRVKTKVDKSKIHGLGLFAAEFIAAGRLVWSFDKGYDQVIPLSFVALRPPVNQNDLFKYCYINPGNKGAMVVCLDDARFANFDETPTLRLGNNYTNNEVDLVAARDIKIGEELTVPYESDADCSRKLGRS